MSPICTTHPLASSSAETSSQGLCAFSRDIEVHTSRSCRTRSRAQVFILLPHARLHPSPNISISVQLARLHPAAEALPATPSSTAEASPATTTTSGGNFLHDRQLSLLPRSAAPPSSKAGSSALAGDFHDQQRRFLPRTTAAPPSTKAGGSAFIQGRRRCPPRHTATPSA